MDLATKQAYIQTRLDKARDDLATAQDDLAQNHLRGAVNRAYYAIFHTASAALLWHDIERSKHSGIQAAFNESLVKPGLIEADYGRLYKDAREWREEQDYSDQVRPLNQIIATQIVNDSGRFLSRLEQYLKETGAIV